MKLNDEQKGILIVTIIMDALTVAFYGIYLFVEGKGYDRLKEKIEERKERRNKRKEGKYATKVVGFEEEES